MPAAPAAPDAPEGVSTTSLRVAVALLAIEALALLGLVVLLAYAYLTEPSVSAGSALATILFAALLALLLGLFGGNLWRRRSWARGPAIVLELLLLPIGYTMASNGLGWLGVPVLLVGLGAAAALLAPATRAALGLR